MTAALSSVHPPMPYPDHVFATQQQPQDTSENPLDTASDPAQSLRQAALLTLRNNKRRKPASSLAEPLAPGLPARPTLSAVPTIQLDYGQGDSATPIASSEPPPTNGPPNPPTSSAPVNKAESAPSKDEDVSMREEGEISESEEEPPPPQPAPPPPPPQPVYNKVSFAKPSSPPSATIPHLPPPPPATPTRKDKPYGAIDTRSIARLPHRPSFSDDSPVTPNTANTESFRLGLPPYVLDANHVRPGLTLTQEQYSTVKDITLDLLGWGVPPEYLVDCGLSRAIVYYVFTELNLRLPVNLDTSGIPPYPPSLDQLETLLQSSGMTNSSMPSPIPRAADARPGSALTSVAQPGPPQATTPTLLHRLSAIAEPFVPQSSPSNSEPPTVSEGSLADMEQQRRQELLARKAVQASRKRKDAPAPTSPGDSTVMDAETNGTALVPESSVDDFLSSIGPTQTTVKQEPGVLSILSANGPSSSATHVLSPEPMDVDDDIPGLSRGNSSADYPPVSRPTDPLPPSSARVGSPFQRSAPDTSLIYTRGPPSHTVLGIDELHRTDSSNSDTDMPNVPSARSSGSTTPDFQTAARLTRRGTKRPVAADFVDLDSSYNGTAAGIQRSDSTGYGSNGHHPNPHVRRRMTASSVGGFANIINVRRCVIDVSDSEDDDGENQEVEDALVTESQPVNPVVTAPAQHQTYLQQEIARMKREIQEKEERRLRKQLTSGRSTPLGPPGLQPTPLSAPIKQEVEESAPENNGGGDADVTMRVESVSANDSLPSKPPRPTSAMSLSHVQDSKIPPIGESSIVADGLPHQVTGERVITAEARQEQVARISSPSVPIQANIF